jgi:hypothetical protein
MTKKPKEDREETDEPCESPDKDRWSEDQKERSYYYDDAHGYETYDPKSDAEEEEEED